MAANPFTYPGHTFTGWSDGTLSYPAGSTYLLSSVGAPILFSAQWSANATDTLTFNSEGGSAVSSESGLAGTTVTLPSAPTLAGYTFNGWFAAPTGGSALTSPYTLAGSVTLYAQWSANATDTYSYTANGGSGTVPAAGSGLDGTAITLAANPFTYPGHTFTGWSDGTLSYPAGSTYLLSSVGAPILFSAQWSANATDTLTFNSEGGSAVSSESGLAGSTVTLPSAPTLAGYTFNGWFAAPTGGSALTSPYTLAGSVTLYAQWSANATDTLTFNSEGGSAVSSESGLAGTTVTLPSAPTLAGYTFNGWFAAPTGGSALTSPYTLAGSVTLYAQWSANATDTYSYTANGGSGTVPAAGSGLDGTAITLAANPFTYPGHTFTGWSDGTLSYPAGSTYLLSSVGAPILFSAQWSANATDTLTFNSEGGSAVSSESGLAGSTVTLPSAPTLAGYTFNGWFAAPTGGSALTSPYTLAGSMTLYAQWSANATDTLTFNSEGGSAVSSESGLAGTTVTLPSAPTLAGYTFNGWFAAPTGGSALTSPYTLAGSVTLYAQWSANATDTYSYTANGGSGTVPAAGSGLDGTAITLAANPFTYPGHTFTGWSDGTLSYPAGSTYLLSSVGAPILFSAQWSANATDTLTFNSEGGSAVSSESGLAGSTVTLPSAPTLAGYTFNGWFAAPTGGSALTSPYTLAGSVTLYAQWSANATDTLTFNSEGGSAVSSESGLAGTTVTLPSAPTLAGYTFNGWFAAPTGGSALTSPYTLAGSMTLYAQWSANATDTLTFNSEGGSAVSSESGLAGTTVTLPSAPTLAGYTFNGWFAAPTGGSALTSPYTLAGSVTLYAQWTPVVSVTVQVSGTQTYGGSPSFTYTTTPTGVTVTSLICTTVGSSTPINSTLGAGTYTILGSSCSGSAGATYSLKFTGVSNSFSVSKAPVAVQVSGTQTYGGSPSLTYATMPSGVSVTSVKCTTVGSSTPINSSLGAGTYTILGSSCSGSASSNYTATFAGVTNGFVVSMATQTVKFTSTAPTNALANGATYTPKASATSKLAVTIGVDSSASAVCSISSAGVVSFQTAGTCLLDANQAGNVDYSAATQVQQSVAVSQLPVFALDTPPTTATVGQSYTYVFSANGTPVPTYALSTGAPSWLSINSTTGVVTGTPPSGTKNFSYSVIASSSAGKTTVGPFRVKVSV